MVYSDVDGTLLGPRGCLFLSADYEQTLVPAKAVLACLRHNLDVVLISGRRREQLHGDARILGFQSWIAELGCQLVYRAGEVVVLNVGDFELTAPTVWQTIRDSGAPQVLLESFPRRLEYHTPWSEGRECSHVFRGFVSVDGVNSLLAEKGFHSLRFVDNGRIHRTSTGLSLDLPELRAYHLLPREAGKARAVRKDRGIRRIPKETTIAIGDAETDLELADEVDMLFLVRNALGGATELEDKIKRYPNVYVTEHAMGLGWAEVIALVTGEALLE